jgi:hypothetical protein
MNSDYSNYLLSIILIIIVVFIGVLFVRGRIRKGRRHEIQVLPVKGGNVSVFFDKAGNVTIIPYVKDKFGSGKATADVEFLKMPYTAQKLGNAVRNSMNLSMNGIKCDTRRLLGILQFYDWQQFSEGKRNISVYFKESYGIIFNTTRRKHDGAYQFNHNGVEMTLPSDTGDETLGNTLIQLLQRCR